MNHLGATLLRLLVILLMASITSGCSRWPESTRPDLRTHMERIESDVRSMAGVKEVRVGTESPAYSHNWVIVDIEFDSVDPVTLKVVANETERLAAQTLVPLCDNGRLSVDVQSSDRTQPYKSYYPDGLDAPTWDDLAKKYDLQRPKWGCK